MKGATWQQYRGKVAAGAAALAFLLLLFFLRPLGIIHGPLMFLYKYPLVWFLPLLGALLVAIITILRRRQLKQQYGDSMTIHDLRWQLEDLAKMSLVGGMILCSVLFFLALIIAPMLTGKAIYDRYGPERLGSLPESGETRIMPREVADVLARNGFSSPTETLDNIHVIRTDDGLQWTFGQSPDGVFRRISKKTAGTATLPADRTSRDIDFQYQKYEVAPGHVWADGVTWKAYKKNYWTEIAESIYLPEANRILVPFIAYEGWPVRVPVLGGVYLISPDGNVEELSVEEAQRNPAIRESGRLFPENLVQRIQNSYKYVHGIWNRLFTHRDILVVDDGAEYGPNPQPHYLDLDGRGTWVSVAEPWGRSDAIGGIFFFDALSGKYSLWRSPREAGLTSARKALDATKSLAIPGISFRSGDFRAVEARPVFRDGKIYFLVSIIPGSKSTVSKSVIVDPKNNKVIALFEHDSNTDADRELAQYLSGEGFISPLGEVDPEEDGKAALSSSEQELIESLLEQNSEEREILRRLLEKYSR